MIDKDMHVMIDLETLGVSAGCSVIAIGAVAFDEDGICGELAYFEASVSRASNAAVGLREDQSTIDWWKTQPALIGGRPNAYVKSVHHAHQCKPIGQAIHDFVYFFRSLPDVTDSITVWGNGADFDLPILAHAIRATGFVVPWAPHMGRCYRTLKNLRPEIAIERTRGGHHDALTDAIDQARHAVRLLEAL